MERREEGVEPIRHLEERKSSWAKLRRVDSLNLEAGRISTFTTGASKKGWSTTLLLAFQCIGVIYGDIGTSPLYVFSSTFRSGISHGDDVFGALSLIIYTLVLVSLLKYVFIVLLANDNGDGGTFALYSLICRYAKVGLIPTHQPEDRELSNYILESPSNQMKRAHKIKEKLENSKSAKVILFLVTILGTSMVIGDGVLTPSISVYGQENTYWEIPSHLHAFLCNLPKHLRCMHLPFKQRGNSESDEVLGLSLYQLCLM